jgi:hypothetical protein
MDRRLRHKAYQRPTLAGDRRGIGPVEIGARRSDPESDIPNRHEEIRRGIGQPSIGCAGLMCHKIVLAKRVAHQKRPVCVSIESVDQPRLRGIITLASTALRDEVSGD